MHLHIMFGFHYIGQRAIAYKQVKLWNRLPECVKKASSLITFKTNFKSFLRL
jgi:hypothetical protein